MTVVVDANVLLRFIVAPTTPALLRQRAVAGSLLAQARDGEVDLLLTDAVIAEVLFILTDPKHYEISREDAADAMIAILSLPGCRTVHRSECLQAIELWQRDASLSFVDALVAALAMNRNAMAATFDRRLQQLEGLDVLPEALAVSRP